MSGTWTDPRVGHGTFTFKLINDGFSIQGTVTNAKGNAGSFTADCDRGP